MVTLFVNAISTQIGEERIMENLEKVAEDHAEWASGFFKWVYKQAFIHGYKHGRESEKRR